MGPVTAIFLFICLSFAIVLTAMAAAVWLARRAVFNTTRQQPYDVIDAEYTLADSDRRPDYAAGRSSPALQPPSQHRPSDPGRASS